VASKILFFLNSNSQTGLGHFSRCLNIARHLKATRSELEIIFQGDLNDFSQRSLKEFGFKYRLTSNPFEGELEIKVDNINIFDSYLLDQTFIDYVCQKSNQNFFIDDFALFDFSKAAGVINFTIAPQYEEPKSAKKMLLGPKFFPYKPEIKKVREKVRKHKIENILVFISNSKIDEQLVQKSLNVISKSVEDLKTNLLLVSNDNDLNIYANKLGFDVKPPVSNIEDYYDWADLIISGGGLVKYESSYCLLPIVSFSLNEGQANDSKLLSQNGLIKYLGPFEDLNSPSSFNEMCSNLNSFIKDDEQRQTQKKRQETTFHSDSGGLLAKELICE